MITIKVYKNGNKTKSQHMTSPDGYQSASSEEIFEELRRFSDEDFKFLDVNNEKDVTHDKTMALLKAAEKRSLGLGDVELMNRIIRGGGFIEYINKLEETKNDRD